MIKVIHNDDDVRVELIGGDVCTSLNQVELSHATILSEPEVTFSEAELNNLIAEEKLEAIKRVLKK